VIVVDSSALIAIILAENEADRFSDLIGGDGDPRMSSVTLLETRTVLFFRGRMTRIAEFDEYLRTARMTVIAFDGHQSELAFDAYRRFGKGNHPAGLNLGDCAAYALAKSLDAPLLFKGNDFVLTDVRVAT
jgi:ribonuclease VapC